MLDTESGCDCTYNFSCAIACRHILVIRLPSAKGDRSASVFNDSDYHKRWNRHSLESQEPFLGFRGFLNRAPDEQLDDDNADEWDDSEKSSAQLSWEILGIRKLTKLLDAAVPDSTATFLWTLKKSKKLWTTFWKGNIPGSDQSSSEVSPEEAPKKVLLLLRKVWLGDISGIPPIVLANATTRLSNQSR